MTLDKQAEIPVQEFDRLCAVIRRGLESPNNPAALALAKASLTTLTYYSPTLLELEAQKHDTERMVATDGH